MKARPWHIFRKDRTPHDQKAERLAICRACDHYSKTTTQCGICGCFMPIKTSLPHAECPIGKWSATAPAPHTPDVRRKDGGAI